MIENKIARSSSGAVALLIILLVILGIFAAATKPNENDLKNALVAKYGLVFGIASELGQKLGIVDVAYHDYLFFSTLTIRIVGDSERTAYGVFGQMIVPGEVPQPRRSESAPTTDNILNNTTTSMTMARPRLVNEMTDAANGEFVRRHPSSRIETESCTQSFDSINQSSQGEKIVGVYNCRMRGAILGVNVFQVSVTVYGEIWLQNGVFVWRIVSSEVIEDTKLK